MIGSSDINTDDVSNFDKAQIARHDKKLINFSGGLKLYVSKKVVKQLEAAVLDLNEREDVKTGKKSLSGIMIEYILKGYAADKAKVIEETVEKEDAKAPLENLRENYMDLVIPGRAREYHIPRLDGYMEYIDNGGIPITELMRRGKLTDKQIAAISVSVEALHTELTRTRSVQHRIKKIMKFKKDVKDKFIRDQVGALAEFVYNADGYTTHLREGRNLFSFYHKFKHILGPKEAPKQIPDEVLPYVANISGLGDIGDERENKIRRNMPLIYTPT